MTIRDRVRLEILGGLARLARLAHLPFVTSPGFANPSELRSRLS